MLPVSSRTVRFCALCGTAAPVIFVLTVGTLGYLTPGYNPAARLMSELGETGAPLAPVMNLAGFVATGFLMILLSVGLREGLGRGRMATAGSLLVAGAGIAYLAMAVFPCDPGCVAVSPAGRVHLILGLLAILMAIVSVFVLGYSTRGKAGWEGCFPYSLVTGVLLVMVLPVFAAAQGSAGLWQRILVGIVLLWEEVMAIRLFLLTVPKA